MTDAVYEAVYDSLKRSIVHTSTYSETALAMRAGLATLEVLEEEGLTARAEHLGQYLRRRLQEALAGYEMVGEVRGLGLFCGIEFAKPRSVKLRAAFQAFRAMHAGLFGQVVVMNLFERGVLTQMCGNNFMVLKVVPPLVVTEAEADEFVNQVQEVVDLAPSSARFWSEPLAIARRAINL